MRAPRRLTVIVSLDVAGYTRLVEKDERGTLAELRAIRSQLAARPRRARRQAHQDHGRRRAGRVPQRRGRGANGRSGFQTGHGGRAMRPRQAPCACASPSRSPMFSCRAPTASAPPSASSCACRRWRRPAASPSPIRCAGSWSSTLAAQFDRAELVRLKGYGRASSRSGCGPGDAGSRGAAPAREAAAAASSRRR